MAVIKFPQHDLPPDLLNSRISGASVEQCNDILVGEFFGPAEPVGGGVTGTMAATESGADTCTASGVVIVKGALAATESGSDAFAASGDVFVKGALAATESGADTAAIAGKVIVAASMAVAEQGQDAASISGAVIVTGTMDATEQGSDVAEIIGTKPVVKKRGGSMQAARARVIKHITTTVESQYEREQAVARIMSETEPVVVDVQPEPTPKPAPVIFPAPIQYFDLSPVLAATQAIANAAARIAAAQAVELEFQRIAQAQELARQQAQAILEAAILAKQRDEDEATALIFIMSAA